MKTFALFGSGEFLSWAEPIDRDLVARSTRQGRKVLIAPLASAPEGDDTFDMWAQMGVKHFTKLGADPEVLDLKTRVDAKRNDLISKLSDASLIYFSGGNPAYATKTLEGTPFLTAMLEQMDQGLVFAGCSAGATMLGHPTFDSSIDHLGPEIFVDGLGVLPKLMIAPHYDQVDNFLSGLKQMTSDNLPTGSNLLGIDENTVVVGDGTAFEVLGEQTVLAKQVDKESIFKSGDKFIL